jgi:hypothetical protein
MAVRSSASRVRRENVNFVVGLRSLVPKAPSFSVVASLVLMVRGDIDGEIERGFAPDLL